MPQATDPSIHIKVERDFYFKLVKLADKERRTMANLCRILIEEALQQRNLK